VAAKIRTLALMQKEQARNPGDCVPSPAEGKEARRIVKKPGRWRATIVAVAAIAFLLKTTLALRTYGTNDVMTWEQDLKKLHDRGATVLYREGVQSFSPVGNPYHQQLFIHPPFVIHLLRFWGLLARVSRLPLGFWMRFTCAIADIGSLLVIWQTGKQRRIAFRPVMLLLFAACPISILISGFHGNTDPIMIFLVLLSVYAIEARKPPLLAGAFMGLAVCIKLTPLIFIPATILYLPRMRDRVYFSIAAMCVFIFAGLPYILFDPLLVLGKLLSYQSLFGLWGWSLILRVGAQNAWMWDNLPRYSEAALVILTVLLSIGMNVSKARLPLFAQCGLIASLFLFFTPGFGVQYLSWLAPWVLYLPPFAAAAYYLTGGAFLFAVYTHLSGGFRWYLANAFEVPGWSVGGVVLSLICWLVTGILLLLYVDAWIRHRRAGPYCGQRKIETT
jgi:hypothetical protein